MFFIRACAAALLRSLSAAFRRLRSLMRSMTEVCSARTRATHAEGFAARSSSSLRSSAARSSRALSFSRRARARASNPALRSFCFFFSLRPSSSSCTSFFFNDHVMLLSRKCACYLVIWRIDEWERGLFLLQQESVYFARWEKEYLLSRHRCRWQLFSVSFSSRLRVS